MTVITYANVSGYAVHAFGAYRAIKDVEYKIITLPTNLSVIDSHDPKKVLRAGYFGVGFADSSGPGQYGMLDWGWLDWLHGDQVFVAPRVGDTFIHSLATGLVATFFVSY